MMANQLVERGYLTQSLGSAFHKGEHGFKAVPGLLKRVLEEKAWEARLIIETGEEFEGFSSFEAYIKTNPPRGLGATISLMDDLIGKDEDLRAKFYAALRRPLGTNQYSEGFNIIKTLPSKSKSAMGDSKAYALQKLSDAKQLGLLEQVKSGKMSANAAMKKAGYRTPKISVRLDNPESAAKTLLTHASPEFLSELRRLLHT